MKTAVQILNELVVERRTGNPTYTYKRKGEDHCPMYIATCTLLPLSVTTLEWHGTKKLAQQSAARMLLAEVAKETSPSPLSQAKQNAIDANFKGMLQERCQQKGIPIPSYNVQPIPGMAQHTPYFICAVTVMGKTYDTTEYTTNKKAAEQLAAKIALCSISKDDATSSPEPDTPEQSNDLCNTPEESNDLCNTPEDSTVVLHFNASEIFLPFTATSEENTTGEPDS